MSTNKVKFNELQKQKEKLYRCTACGYCTLWCPIYQEDPQELSVSRGKLSALKSLLENKQEYTEELGEALNRCMLCGTCAEHCVSKSEGPVPLLAARADVMKAKGIGFPYNIVYQSLLPRRTLFGNVVKAASMFQKTFMPRTEGTVRHLPMFLSAMGKGRQLPTLSSKFLRQIVPEVNKPPAGTKTRMRVGYFMGCMTDFVYVSTGKHIIDFLTRNGVEVVVPKGQGCCGAPVYLGAGDFVTGRKLADTNVKVFADLDVDYIVTSCATCGSAMQDYKKFLADTPERTEAYTKLHGKLRDITVFVTDVLQLPASAFKASAAATGKKVTWHDPCHLNRYQGIKEQPRRIMKSISGIDFVEMVRPDWCCGMAGAFSLHYYELSKKINAKKIETIKDTNADILATDCTGCMTQFIDNFTQNKMPTKVMHIMDLLE